MVVKALPDWMLCGTGLGDLEGGRRLRQSGCVREVCGLSLLGGKWGFMDRLRRIKNSPIVVMGLRAYRVIVGDSQDNPDCPKQDNRECPFTYSTTTHRLYHITIAKAIARAKKVIENTNFTCFIGAELP